MTPNAYYSRRKFTPDALSGLCLHFEDSPTLNYYGVAYFSRPLTADELDRYDYRPYDAEGRELESDAAALYRAETRGAW